MPPALRHTAGCPSGQRERSVKPSAQPTLVRTQHLPPPAKTAPWLRKRGPAGRFLLVTMCISACHYGSMHGSVRVHMVYSARVELAVLAQPVDGRPSAFCLADLHTAACQPQSRSSKAPKIGRAHV